jgi:hypothetical protein
MTSDDPEYSSPIGALLAMRSGWTQAGLTIPPYRYQLVAEADADRISG